MRFHSPLLIAAALVVTARVVAGQEPSALEGWQRYVAAVESRRQAEEGGPETFLSGGDRRELEAGRVVVERVHAPSPAVSVEIDEAMVHHWRGAVFLRGVTLDALLERLQSQPPPLSAEVLRARILERRPSSVRVYLRLQRTKIVTAVYDTEHDVTFVRHDTSRASSRSVATRIVELQDPGTAAERQRAPGEDRGFLWRLNAYWRYEAVPGGVIAECESISLSRDVPFGLGAIAGPIIRSTARESMERTLESLREMVESK